MTPTKPVLANQGSLLQVNPPNKKARSDFIGLALESDQNNFPENYSEESVPQIPIYIVINTIATNAAATPIH